MLNRDPRKSWNPVVGSGRIASLLRFVLALGWFELAGHLAAVSAHGLAPYLGGEDLYHLIQRILLLFLLVTGYGYMGLAFDRQQRPLSAMGLKPRPGWAREFAVGAAVAWGAVLVVAVVIALGAWLRIEFWTEPRAFWLLGIDLAVIAVATLAEEVAFRGYAFQRLMEAIGPTMATVLMALLVGAVQWATSDGTGVSVLVAMLTTVLFSIAYLRTRALWLPWGAHFAWNVCLGVLFGLPLSGVLDYATVVQGRALGARWLTGGSYGPEGSVVTVFALLGAIIVLVMVTREYAWQYAQPVIVPGGMVVDVAPPAAHTAMQAAAPPAGSTLVQIAAPPPAQPLPPSRGADESTSN